jgi:DNA repair protein RadC
MLGIKRVENRSMMPSPVKGRSAVGCSKSFCKEEYGNFVQWASQALQPDDFQRIPAWGDVKEWPGKIVGACDYEARGRNDLRLEGDAAVAGRPPYQWDEGYAYWWDLSEVVCFDGPIPCRGNVGMWQMPNALAAEVTRADACARSVGVKVSSSADAARIFRDAIAVSGMREGFFVLPLDASRRTLSAPILVSLGADSGTAAVDAGEVFRVALKADAEAMIVAHNHPSGDLRPSLADMALTRTLEELATYMNVRILDHLIFCGNSYKDISINSFHDRKE